MSLQGYFVTTSKQIISLQSGFQLVVATVSTKDPSNAQESVGENMCSAIHRVDAVVAEAPDSKWNEISTNEDTDAKDLPSNFVDENDKDKVA